MATAVRHTYPIEEDDKLFRSQPDRFEYLRNNYRMRREFGAFSVSVSDGEAAEIIRGLGFNVIKKTTYTLKTPNNESRHRIDRTGSDG